MGTEGKLPKEMPNCRARAVRCASFRCCSGARWTPCLSKSSFRCCPTNRPSPESVMAASFTGRDTPPLPLCCRGLGSLSANACPRAVFKASVKASYRPLCMLSCCTTADNETHACCACVLHASSWCTLRQNSVQKTTVGCHSKISTE